MSRKPAEYREEDEAIARLREELKQRFPLPTPTPARPRRPAAKALGLALLVAAAVAWIDPAYRSEHYATAVGQRQAVQLADGSQLLLDSASTVAVSWHLRSRQVELKQGQALFEVTAMRYRPFLVDAGSTRIRVVGTRFNVSRQTQDVRVTVAEGKVAVRASGGEALALLEPGQQLHLHNGIAGQPTPANAEDVMAWQHSQLVFESTPLGEALEILQRHHRQPIRLLDPGLASLPISGVFDSDHVERLLALLPGILPLTVTHAADGAILIAPARKK